MSNNFTVSFWPSYLRAHSSPMNRACHYAGSTLALVGLAGFVITADLRVLIGAAMLSYGTAWFGHLAFQRNVPETFFHPVLSFVGNWRMFQLAMRGKLRSHLEAHGVNHRTNVA